MDNNNRNENSFPRIELTDGGRSTPTSSPERSGKGSGSTFADKLKNIRLQPYWSFGIASFVLGIIAIVFIWTEGIAYIPSIIGLILAIVARKKGNDSGFVTAGLWLNIIPIVGTTVLLILTAGLCAACAAMV